MTFEADWLAARAPYDEAALDAGAVALLVAWGRRLPPDRAAVVVDLGAGTGAALRRVARWLAPRPLVAYAVDHDAALLARAKAGLPFAVHAVEADLLRPLAAAGGPPDGAVDLVVGHALADVLPLDRLAMRAAALLRPGGLAHLALTYDGLTAFSGAAEGPEGPGSVPVNPRPTGRADAPPSFADLDRALLAAFHRHMDRPARTAPSYGGATAGRRLGPALASAGLEILADAPSVWAVGAADGDGGRRVLDRLVRYVVEAARDLGEVPAADIARWDRAQRAALADGTLAARVGHRDVLARRPT